MKTENESIENEEEKSLSSSINNSIENENDENELNKNVIKINNNLFILQKIEIKSNEEKNKILSEIKKLNLIDSKYILKVEKYSIEKEEEKEIAYIYINYYKNNLEKIIYELNFLNSRIIWKIFFQLLLGLQSLHLNNILIKYFDAKNIFLDNENNIKIGGIFNFLNFSEENEYFLEEEEIDENSNVFSLGCILYELVLKKKPNKNLPFDFYTKNCEDEYKIILSKLLCYEKNRLSLNKILLEPIIKKIIIKNNLFDEIIKDKIKSKNKFLILFFRFL